MATPEQIAAFYAARPHLRTKREPESTAGIGAVVTLVLYLGFLATIFLGIAKLILFVWGM